MSDTTPRAFAELAKWVFKGVVSIVFGLLVVLGPLAGDLASANPSPWPHWNRMARADLSVFACPSIASANALAPTASAAQLVELGTSSAPLFRDVIQAQPLRGSAKSRFNKLLAHLAAGNTTDATSLCQNAGLGSGIGTAFNAATTTTTTVPIQVAPPSSTGGGSTGRCYIDPEGNCYRAGEYCPNALHGQTVQGSSGPIVCTNNNGWRWEPA